MPDFDIDIKEDSIVELSPAILEKLLVDHSKGHTPKDKPKKPIQNIIWATNDYVEQYGDRYEFHQQILPELITGERGNVIRPRAAKARDEQRFRSREMAEVFTPSWVCNAQNNLVDEAWFGRKDVFNREINDGANHTWEVITDKITFPEGKTWKDYVRSTRLEITCGEAPYLASRYDTTTGEFIPVERRIGMLDRKLRVVSENTEKSGDWLKWAKISLQNIYGYEWQGDSLLIARETLLYTFMEFYEAKFGKSVPKTSLPGVAYIVSWNLFQMDGLKGVIPETCRHGVAETEQTLFGETEVVVYCEGCKNENSYKNHNGIYALVRDWGAKAQEKKVIRFVDLIK